MSKIKWRCIVCGKLLTPGPKPEACLLCGATADYIVAQAVYKSPTEALSPESVADLDRAMALEVEATRLYNEASERAKKEGDILIGLFFEALAKNEHGHQIAIKYQKELRDQ